ncbi:MAG: glycine cleavage T C-terminal barrel domain-containing protein [Nocardioidaceae bacterium]
MAVADSAGDSIGVITSGTFSPSRKQGVGLALLSRSIEEETEVYVDVRGRREPFTRDQAAICHTRRAEGS